MSATHAVSTTVQRPALRGRAAESAGAARPSNDDMLSAALRRWSTRMLAEGKADTTVVERVRQVRRLAEVDGLDVFDLDEDDVLAYLSRRDLSANSRVTYYGGLKAWHRWLVGQGYRADDPMQGLDSPKVPAHQIRPITSEHIDALLSSGIRTRTRGMILLGAYAGLRAHEIAKFRTEDVDVRAGVMEVVGKGGKSRYVAVHPMVAEYALTYAPNRGYWFPSRRHAARPVLVRSVITGVSKAMARAGVPGTCHSLRRWFATTMVENGVDLRVVQQLLGHASIATTQKYLYVQPARALAAVSRLPLLGGGVR